MRQMSRIFSPRITRKHTLEAKRFHCMLEEFSFLASRLDQRGIQTLDSNMQRNTGKARAGADVRNPHALFQLYGTQYRQRIEVMPDHHGMRLDDRSQVRMRIPLQQFFSIAVKQLELFVVQLDAEQLRRVGSQIHGNLYSTAVPAGF